MSYISSRSVRYKEHGDPRKVLYLSSEKVSTSLSPSSVLVEWIASPINPLDINKIQGAYMLNASLPAVGGSEAVGRVVKVGAEVGSLSPGDCVIAFTNIDCPVWAEYSTVEEKELIKVHSNLPPTAGATLLVNPPTAWLMLKKFVKMEAGDWIIQNSANSGVGRAVIQLCKIYGYNSINVVRNRAEIAALKNELLAIGGTEVWTEEEMTAKRGKDLPARPKLAFNGVGGRSCLHIAAALDRGGTIITYGGMSKQPHEISSSAFIFNDIHARGIANGLWMKAQVEGRRQEVVDMINELQNFLLDGRLKVQPMDLWPLEKFQEAIQRSMEGRHLKQCFVIKPESHSSKL